MQEPVEDGRGHRGITEILAPVLHDTVGSDDAAATLFVTLMDDGLQEFGACIGDATGKEQIVEQEQMGFDVRV